MNKQFINIDFNNDDDEDDSDYVLEDSSSEDTSTDYEYILDDDLDDLDYKKYKSNNKKRKRKIINKNDLEEKLIKQICKNVKTRMKSTSKKLKSINKSPKQKISKKKRIKGELNKDKYFRVLSKEEKKNIVNTEYKLYKFNKKIIPNRYKIINLDTSIANKSIILNKLDIFKSMSEESGEFYKLSKWINGISMIPFGKYKINDYNKDSDKNDIQTHINKCYGDLDNTIYGQYTVKNKIIQVVSQNIINPMSNINIIALQGPPGVGKTSLIKNGLSKIMNKPFHLIPLGGCSDSSTLDGHNYTYEGSTWGKLVNILMQSQCMNPIIYFDELDKISKTPRGKEIVGLLTHLTDPIQNQNYMDKYYEGIKIDFSKVFFIFSFNNINLIDPILKDRLTIIKYDSYKTNDKIIIAKKYLLPSILNNMGNDNTDYIFDDTVISYLIKNFVDKEEGVRNLKRSFEDIIMKLNLLRFINLNTNKVKFPYDINELKKHINIPINIPLTINKNIIKFLINKNTNKLPISIQHMYL